MAKQKRKEVVEFIIPFLIERNIGVNRTEIEDFLKRYRVETSREFRTVFDHKDGLMNNFCRIYSGREIT